MFRILRSVKGHLAALARTFDPDTLTVAQAAEAISLLAAIEKAAAGLRLLLARRVDNQSLWGESGERSAADWLARQTGQSTNDAARDLECSRRLQALPEASDAVRNGELSPDQAKAVADGAAADPAAEHELLDTARRGSLGELNRKAKSRKAAALGDDEARARAAHRNRSFTSGTNAMGEGWGRFNGPAHQVALLNAQLKPFLERAFALSRRQGCRERADALAYDALMAFAGIVDLDGTGTATGSSAASGDGTQDSPPQSAGTPSGDGAQDSPPRSTATPSGSGVGAPAGHSNAGGAAPDAGSQPTGGRETAATSGARRARTPGTEPGTRSNKGASDGHEGGPTGPDATAPHAPAGRAATQSAPLTLLDGLEDGGGHDGLDGDGLDGDGLDGDGLDGDADDLAAGSGTPRGPEPGPGSARPPGAAPPSPPGSIPAPPPLRPKREPIRPDVKLIVRIDGSALQRGHTVPGELCDLHGFGPVSVADVKALLPDAAIDFVITNGRDVFNVSHLGRHATARQQVVLDLLNIGCSREGCGATQHLQVDHRIDWHKIKVTELANLDWLCPHDHRLKTHEGWQLEPGTGKRPMRPPGQQPWLEAGGEAAAGPPPHAA